MYLLNLLSILIASGKSNAIKAAEKDISVLEHLSISDLINKFAQTAIDFAFKVVIAVIVFYIGKFLINKLYKITKAIMVRRKVELSLATFILSLLKITLLFLLIVIVIGILGIETSSFIAIFASAGVAIGMALSGTLQNFAGGVLILLIKPYKVGDFIEVQGYSGTVKEIQIFYTILNTIDNKSIIIPNGSLSTGTINNYSKEEYRRVDWTVSLAYGDDVDKAKALAYKLLSEDDRILKSSVDQREQDDVEAEDNEQIITDSNGADKKKGFLSRIFRHSTRVQIVAPSIPEAKFYHEKIAREPFVALSALADSSINLVVRAWTRSESYYAVFYDMNERFYKEYPKAGFSFPFPQMDVHLNPDN